MIIKQLPVGELQANCYIIGCEETHAGLIIDPGAEADRILQTVAGLKLNISHILLTHAHFDHIAALAEVVEATGAPMLMHQADLPLLEAGGGARLFNLPMPRYQAPDGWLDEGDSVSVGQYRLKVLFTPGHAPGHISFYEATAGVVFDGDVLFAGSIGRYDLPGGSLAILMKSITEKLLTLPNETLVYSGHGPQTSIGHEKRTNPFLH